MHQKFTLIWEFPYVPAKKIENGLCKSFKIQILNFVCSTTFYYTMYENSINYEYSMPSKNIDRYRKAFFVNSFCNVIRYAKCTLISIYARTFFYFKKPNTDRIFRKSGKTRECIAIGEFFANFC